MVAWRARRQAGRGERRRGLGCLRLGAVLVMGTLVTAGAVGCGAGGGGGTGENSVQRPPQGAFVPSGPSRPAVLWAVGDGADGGAAARQVTALIAAHRPDRLLYLGDVYETGSASDFANHYATTFGRLASRTAPTPGNHDWPQHLQGYDPYWGRSIGRPPPGFYAFHLGGWDIISLNSEGPHAPGSAQDRWLRAQVHRPGTCRLAFWHRPRYSGGVEHGDESDVQPFWDALRGHATLIANGHEHDMQRFRPVDGLTEFVAGAGGHSRYAVRPHPGLAFSNASDYGALRLELRPGSARWSFIALGGRVLDSGQVGCREG